MPIVHLSDRALVRVAGEEARAFLQGLVTCDMDQVSPGHAGFGALLSPQGKILFDFLIVETDGFLIDAPASLAADLAKRLGFYKLRAHVTVAPEPDRAVLALWPPADTLPADAIVFADPRAASLGQRAVVAASDAERLAGAPMDAYEAHRIAAGIPKGGADFVYGDAFPHEANMDLIHGVSFEKGCYVGQEVVSRTQHRGIARKRILSVTSEGNIAPGSEISAGGIALGTVGSVQGTHGLATIRIDRLSEAQAQNLVPQAEGHALTIVPLAVLA